MPKYVPTDEELEPIEAEAPSAVAMAEPEVLQEEGPTDPSVEEVIRAAWKVDCITINEETARKLIARHPGRTAESIAGELACEMLHEAFDREPAYRPEDVPNYFE
jgi:hypothetical protein